MCQYYVQCLPSCKQFDPWDVDHLLSFVKSWALTSSRSTSELAWKRASLLALFTVKRFGRQSSERLYISQI